MAAMGPAPQSWVAVDACLGAVGVGSPILPALRVLSGFPAVPRLRRHESSLSLHQYFQYDTLQQKLRCLEEENQKLRMEVSGAGWWDPPPHLPMPPSLPGDPRRPSGRLEVPPVTFSPSNTLAQATNITTETSQYEDQEQQLMIDCVEQFCTWGWAGGAAPQWVGGSAGAGALCSGSDGTPAFPQPKQASRSFTSRTSWRARRRTRRGSRRRSASSWRRWPTCSTSATR